MTINDFSRMKKNSELISIVTCYDYWSSRIINETGINAVLVGDSAAMVIHGFNSTINADVRTMLYHIASVRRGLTDKFLIADMPFLAHKQGYKKLMKTVDKYMKAGAQAIKIEGAGDQLEIIRYTIKAGIPVMGHLGLTPQSFHTLGGFKLQGSDETSAKRIIEDAKKLEQEGVFSIVLEKIPSELAKTISESLAIPTIGIGAGKYTDGQILVYQDLLGLTKNFEPKYLRKYLEGFDIIKEALEKFNYDIKRRRFPAPEESYLR